MVPHRPPLLVRLGLGEDRPQFDLPGFGGAILLLAGPARQFLRHHRHARAIDFDIKDGNGRRIGAGPLGQLGGHGRRAEVDQPVDLAAFQANARLGQQILAGPRVAFLGRRPGRQPNQGGREAVDQAQRLVERKPARVRRRVVEIVPARLEPDAAKQSVDVFGPVGMAFFTGPAGIVRHCQTGLVVELFEQAPAILEQSLAQAQLHRLQVGDPLPGQTLADQVQEGRGLLELLVGDLLRLKFFFTSWDWSCRQVSWSLRVTNSSASAWKFR